MPGPKSIITTMEESGKRCYSCAMGRKMTLDIIEQCENSQKEVLKLNDKNKALEMEVEVFG